MNKKILLGSILAVVLLVLVSFTSVVGYRSVKSDSKIISPLFGIMTNRAINKEQDAVTSDYIGKGKAINILLPKRNDDVDLMYRMIDSISKMNDRTFDRFLDLVRSRLSHEEGFTNEKIDEIVEQCRYTREYPKEVKSVVVNDKIRGDTVEFYCWTFNDGSFPLFCFVLDIIITIIYNVAMSILNYFLHTSSIICYSDC